MFWICAGALVCLLLSSLATALDATRLLEAAAKRGARVLEQARALLQLVERSAALDDDRRLALVNDFFNQRIAFKEDIEVWGVLDYWASPLEALDKAAGDCEDYAIAKFAGLLSMGVPVSKLRLVYVRALISGKPVAHMVLAFYAAPGAEPLILDNLRPDVRPASQRPDLQPVFSFNSEGLWQGAGGPTASGATAGNASAGDPVARLSHWRGVLVKLREEGFL